MVKIGEKTVVSVTCQDVILQLAEQYCSRGEYLHFGRKEDQNKYVLVTDEKIYMITSKVPTAAGAKHKEDVFSIQYTKMQKQPLKMKFEGWAFEMPMDGSGKQESLSKIAAQDTQTMLSGSDNGIDPADADWTNQLTAEINCLKEILAEGLITQEEYESVKDRLSEM
jgi:pentose-5-phosphate-3-epimerase